MKRLGRLGGCLRIAQMVCAHPLLILHFQNDYRSAPPLLRALLARCKADPAVDRRAAACNGRFSPCLHIIVVLLSGCLSCGEVCVLGDWS